MPSALPTQDVSIEQPFLRSLAIQMRVIWALCLRESLTRFGRNNLGFLWLFIEPMTFTLGVTFVWSLSRMTHGATVSVASFALTGYSSVLLWRNPASRISKAIESNLALLYHRNVRVFDIFISRILLEIIGISASFFGLMLVLVFFEVIETPVDLVTLIAGWGLLSAFSIALALTIGALSEQSDFLDRIWHAAAYLLFPFSGAGTLADWLPPGLRVFILKIPFVHGVEMIRHGFYGDAIRTYEDPVYLTLCTLVLFALGLFLSRGAAKIVEPD